MTTMLACRIPPRLLVLLGTLTALAGIASCSGEAPGNSAQGGMSNVGGGAASGGAGGTSGVNTGRGVCESKPVGCYLICQGGICDQCFCPGTGGTNAGAGGQASTGGGTPVVGTAGGACGSGCKPVSTTPSGYCDTTQPVSLSCMGPLPSNLSTIMSANGCWNIPIDSIAYCCPSAILTSCQ
jgi:hypothetical protein